MALNWVTVILVVAGLIFAGISIAMFISARNISGKTLGRVASVIRIGLRRVRIETVYSVNGKEYTISYFKRSSPPIGSGVDVYYNPAKPEKGSIRSSASTYALAVMCLVLSILMLTLGVYVYKNYIEIVTNYNKTDSSVPFYIGLVFSWM